MTGGSCTETSRHRYIVGGGGGGGGGGGEGERGGVAVCIKLPCVRCYVSFTAEYFPHEVRGSQAGRLWHRQSFEQVHVYIYEM